MKRLFYRHIQNIINAFSFIFYFQRLAVIAFAAADFTRNVNIRQEMHLDLQDTVSGAGFTASAFYIEAESSFFIAACLGILCRRKQITDLIKYAGVRCRIGTRCSPDR